MDMTRLETGEERLLAKKGHNSETAFSSWCLIILVC